MDREERGRHGWEAVGIRRVGRHCLLLLLLLLLLLRGGCQVASASTAASDRQRHAGHVRLVLKVLGWRQRRHEVRLYLDLTVVLEVRFDSELVPCLRGVRRRGRRGHICGGWGVLIRRGAVVKVVRRLLLLLLLLLLWLKRCARGHEGRRGQLLVQPQLLVEQLREAVAGVEPDRRCSKKVTEVRQLAHTGTRGSCRVSDGDGGRDVL